MIKRLAALALLCAGFLATVKGQVITVTATSGAATGSYPNLGAAFTAINNGQHSGSIEVRVNGLSQEASVPAILNASGTGPALYSKIRIYPTVTNAAVEGSPLTGNAVIQLNGADNVTITGALNGGNNALRTLTIRNMAPAGVNNTAAIWLRSNGLGVQGCSLDSLVNLNISGNDPTLSGCFGIIGTGTTLAANTSGQDNDDIRIINNAIFKCFTAIHMRGQAGALLNGLVIRNNEIGSNNPTEYNGGRGIDVQNASNGLISQNHIFNLKTLQPVTVIGIDAGVGNSNLTISQNRLRGIWSQNTGGWGAYGINLSSGTNTVVANNMIADLQTINYSNLSTTFNAFGIRLSGGSNHKILYNSIHLYGTIGIGASSCMSSCIVITTSSAFGLDIRNNVFQNKMVSLNAGSKMYLFYAVNGLSFSTSTINFNGYFLPPLNTLTTSYAVATVGGADRDLLTDWRGYTQQDFNSLPVNRMLCNFVTDENLHVIASPSPTESAGTNVPGFTMDYDNDVRQGNGGYLQVPAGIAPDIGCDESGILPSDYLPPAIVSVSVNPPGNGCSPSPHTVTATITDFSSVLSAQIIWTLNGVAQAPIPMTNAAAIWTGIIPASGNAHIVFSIKATDNSPNQNAVQTPPANYQDVFYSTIVNDDTTVCQGSPVVLQALTTNFSKLKITEITQFRTGTGSTLIYPIWILGEDLVEITNLGSVPIDLSGFRFEVMGATTRNYTFAAGTILMDSTVLVLHVGSGQDEPSLNYFNTGGLTDDILSGDPCGYILRNVQGFPVDAVATNSYAFPFSTGLSQVDWNGNVNTSSSRAGLIRLVSDNNNASDWTVANLPSPEQTIGSLNPNLFYSVSPNLSWTPGGLVNARITIVPSVTTPYIATISDAGCQMRDTVLLSVHIAPPPPVVQGDTICGVDTAQCVALGPGVMRWWDAPTGGNFIGTGNYYNYLASQSDTFYVAAADSVCPSARIPVPVRVNPAVPISLTASNDTVCQGDIIQLTASTNDPTYVISFSGPDIVSVSGLNATAMPQGPATYLVEGENSSCRAVDSVFVYSWDPGTVNAIVSDTVICEGDSLSLTAVTSISWTDTTWFQFNGPLSIPDADSSGVVAALNVSGLSPAGLSVANMAGVCFDISHSWDADLHIYLISPANDTMMISTANGASGDNYTNTCIIPSAPLPVNFGFPPFTGNYRPEDPLGFNAIAGTNPNGVWKLWVADFVAADTGRINYFKIGFSLEHPSSFAWTSTNGLNSTDEIITDAPLSNTTYYLTLTDSITGCSISDTVNVVVNAPLAVIATGDTAICTGQPVYLFSSVSGGTGNYQYAWSNGAGNGNFAFVAPTVTTTYTLSVSDVCASGPATDDVTVTVYDANVYFGSLTPDTVICEGVPLLLEAHAFGGGGVFSYVWSNGAGVGPSVTVTPPVNTIYTVTATDQCGSSVSLSVTVDLDQQPNAWFTWTPTGPMMVDFTDGSSFATSVFYDFGDGNTSTQSNPSHTYVTGGNYTVMQVATNPCGSDTVYINVAAPVSVDAPAAWMRCEVFPNPSAGQFEVRLSGLVAEAVVEITDLRGVVIESREVRAADAQELFDFSAHSRGTYLVHIRAGDSRYSQRIVIQ